MRTALRLSWIAMALGLVLNFATSLFAISEDRSLFIDGSWFLFRVLNYKQTSFGGNGYRYLSSVLEIPSVILARAWPRDELSSLVTKVWETCFVLPPYVSLLVCLILLRKAGRVSLISIPLLSFALASQISLMFAANQIVEVLSVLWPTLILVGISDLRNPWNVAGICFGTGLLCITHESAVVGFGLLAWVAMDGARRHPGLKTRYWALIALFCFGGLECVMRALLGPYPTLQSVISSAPHPSYFFPLQIRVVLGVLALRAVAVRVERFARFEAIGHLGLAVCVLAWAAWGPVASIGDYEGGRLHAVFLATLVGLVFWISAVVDFRRAPMSSVCFNTLVAATLIYSARADVNLTRQWQRGVRSIARLEQERGPGCHLVSDKEFAERLQDHGIRDVSLALTSVILQKSRKLSTILFVHNPWEHRSEDAICGDLRTKGLMSFFGEVPILLSDYYAADFAKSVR